MSCFRNLCRSRREKEAIPHDMTSTARPTTPRHQALRQSESPVRRAASPRTSRTLSSSVESASSESAKLKPMTKYLSSLLNDTTTPANLRDDFSNRFGTGDPGFWDEGSQNLTGTVEPGSGSVLSGLTPKGDHENKVGNNWMKPKPADSGASKGVASANLVTEASGPGASDLLSSWAAANASVDTEATSRGGSGISCDAGMSSTAHGTSGDAGAYSCDTSGAA